MENLSFKEAVERLTQRDTRYAAEAYLFIRDGLEFTVKHLKKGARGLTRHVTGQELCEGLCDYALEEYGPMALFTLKSWGITRTEDFGELVFNLIEAGKLGKTEEDKKEDFAHRLDLVEILGKPYEVAPEPARRKRRR
jgi:uncharacterized repeat protein (TIGR04138 family)